MYYVYYIRCHVITYQRVLALVSALSRRNVVRVFFVSVHSFLSILDIARSQQLLCVRNGGAGTHSLTKALSVVRQRDLSRPLQPRLPRTSGEMD